MCKVARHTWALPLVPAETGSATSSLRGHVRDSVDVTTLCDVSVDRISCTPPSPPPHTYTYRRQPDADACWHDDSVDDTCEHAVHDVNAVCVA